MSTSIKQMVKYFKEKNDKWVTGCKKSKPEAIVKAISDVLKTYDWTFNMYNGWGISVENDKCIEIEENIWLKILVKAFEKLNFEPSDFAYCSIRDYITTDIMKLAKEKGVIHDFKSSFAESKNGGPCLKVFIYIDGPRDNTNDTKKKSLKTLKNK